MTPIKKLLQTTALFAALCVASQAKEITLTVNNPSALGAVVLLDTVTIGANEVAEVKSLYGVGTESGSSLVVIKNGITNRIGAGLLRGGGSTTPLRLPTVAGPATIRLEAGSGSETWNCTVKIEPESFPPDKTIIIPQGTPGANIIMEQSSDLVHWTNSVPGLYTNTAESHLFFRIRAERF